MREIDFEKIERAMPGLEQYRGPSVEQVKE